MVIYYNFDGDSSNQDKKFKELKNHLNGYQNRKLVFHFDKLEEGDHKLVRISGKEIHLDYDSYTKVEVSGGVKLADTDERWKNIHADFETNPHMIKNWTDLSFTFDQVRDWINIGILPDEQMLVSWLIAVKKGRHNEPEWVLNNADMTKLRREWLEYEIDKRLKKYKTKSWDAEAEFERFAGKDGKGHWGSVERGKSWREYVKKIKEVDESDDLSYKSARGNVLYGLAEFLIPEFISRWTQKTSGKRNMKKAEILDYINQNCSTNENSYYNNVDGSTRYSS